MTTTPDFGSVLALLGGGLLAERLASAVRIPDIVMFLVAGVVLGPVTGLVHMSPSGAAAQFVLTFGAAFMLYEGGRRLSWDVLREIWLGLTLLSTLGVLVTAGVIALTAHLVLGEPWPQAGLLAAVVASTDPATIVPLFQDVRVRPRLARLVEAESACNDALAAALTFAILDLMSGSRVSLAAGLGHFAWNLAGGALLGLACGALAAWLIPGRRGIGLFRTREQAGVLALTVVLGAYLAATALGASGYMAAFAAGVATGNRHLLEMVPPVAHRRVERVFFGYASVLVRMMIFLVAGDIVDLRALAHWGAPALAVAGVLLLVARPLTVLACLPVDRIARWSREEMLFAGWVRETGVIPVALAGVLVQRGVPGAPVIEAVVLTVVLATMLIQVPTTRWWARRLGVAGEW